MAAGVSLSLSSIAQEFGTTRETASKRLDAAGVKPSGKRGGHPVYRLRDVLRAVPDTAQDAPDPDKLDPYKREAFYRGELAKLKLQGEMRELVPRMEMEQEFARVLKALNEGLEMLSDTIDRELGASAETLQRLDGLIDAARERMYGAIAGTTMDDEEPPEAQAS